MTHFKLENTTKNKPEQKYNTDKRKFFCRKKQYQIKDA